MLRNIKTVLLYVLMFAIMPLKGELTPNEIKHESNARILKILNILNNVDFGESAYSYGKSFANNLNKAKENINAIDDSMDMAKLIIIAYYLVYPGKTSTLKFDKRFALLGISNMKRFKKCPNFTEAMLLIDRSIRLDAGYSYMFSEVIWHARDIDGIKKHFKERIKLWADGIRKYGSKSDRKILEEYELTNADIFKQ